MTDVDFELYNESDGDKEVWLDIVAYGNNNTLLGITGKDLNVKFDSVIDFN